MDANALNIAGRRAAFVKARAVLERASKDNLRRLLESPSHSVGEFELTKDEAGLIRDAVDQTRSSRFAEPPEGCPDKLPELYELGERVA